MSETIYISNYKDEFEKLNDCLSSLENNNVVKFKSFHVDNGCLRIHLEKGYSLNPEAIKGCKLSCVVQNELFRTIYQEGERIFWSSLYDRPYSSPSHSL